MIITASLSELMRIVNVEHGNPHSVLGMHEISHDGKDMVSVRAMVPQAKNITVIDDNDENKTYLMKKLHDDGFFEVAIKNRKKWFKYKLQIEDFEGNMWITYDPYSFQPTISSFDRYLFGAGTHYEIYKKLGSHIMKIDGIEGVSFAVWAPNAKSVSVVGSFNNWDGRRHEMRCLGESGIWEIFIPGLCQGDMYKYQVKSQNDDIVLKTDPYGNFAEVRPGVASVVFDIDKYSWNDSNWIEYRENSDLYNAPMNVYEVHLGSWMRVPEEDNRSLTYIEAAEKLVKYVKEMGYTHIELMPVEEYPFDGSWGYQVTGYYAPTSRYGNPYDFKKFVDIFHQNNIGIILDWVPAHFPKDAHGLARFDGTALYEHQDPRQGEHPDWGTYIFNYGRNEVRNFLIANALFWIGEYHIDALRVDAVASMLYLDYGKEEGQWVPNYKGGRENLDAEEFLKHMNSVVFKKFPGAMMIAEESTAWPAVSRSVEEGGLGFSLKWNMGWMNDFLSYVSDDPIYRKYHHDCLTFSLIYAFTENFVLVLSHDEVVHGKGSLIGKMPGDMWQKFANLRAAYGYMYGHPGKKLLFMGGEFGQFSEWSEAKSLDWHLLEYESHSTLKNYVKDLNHMYLNEPSLWERDFGGEGFEWIDCSDYEKSMVSFIRKGKNPSDFLIFVCNFTPVVYNDFRVGVPEAGVYQEIFNSDNEIYGGSGVINQCDMISEEMEWNGRENSIGLRIPPLGITVLKIKR